LIPRRFSFYDPNVLNEKVTNLSLLTPSRPPIAILGVPFDPVTTDETIDAIASMIASRRPHYVVTANVDFVVQALDDIELRKIIFDSHLVVCDGMPLVWASRFLGNPLPERVTGSDLTPRLLAAAERHGWRVFYLGGRQESLDNAVRASVLRHPKLQIVGAYSPPFKPLLDFDHAEIRRRILDARPDLLLVAFGCPKQEKWINMYYRDLGVPVCIGVGASLAFVGGTLRRAPMWMQRTGTEWVFRLAQEPGRLGGRYGKGVWVFGRAILKQWLMLRSRRKHARLNPRPANPPLPLTASPTARGTAVLVPWTVLTAPERLDAVAVRDFGDSWLQAGETARLAIDLAATRFVDSTGVGLLVRLRKRAGLRQIPLTLCRITPVVDRALALMRIGDFFDRIDAVPTYPGEVPQIDRSPAVTVHSIPAGLSIRWSGEITADNTPDLTRQLEPRIAALPPGSRVEIRLTDVSFVDSSGVGLFVGLKKRAWRQEVLVIYREPSPAVRNVIRLTHLEEYLLQERLP
jgi:N-acetylglucosaminyldiphosphoundecaprenol N-acetyl-beta-D-mannosaminyltransferase